MAKIIDTSRTLPTDLSPWEREQVYKPVELTQGFVAWVDAEDFGRINAFNWFVNLHSANYIRAARMSSGRIIYMHHQVLEIMPWKLGGKQVDHIDRNPLHNWKSNLRIVSKSENMRNTMRHLNRKGYCFNKRAGLYYVYLDTVEEGRINLGYTRTEEEAKSRIQEARSAYYSN